MSQAIEVRSKVVATKPGGSVTPTVTKSPVPSPGPGPSAPPAPPKPQASTSSTPPSGPSVSSSTNNRTTVGDPSDTIIISVIVMMGSALIKDVAHNSPSVKPIVTGFALGAALLILGTFSPTLAKGLAITGMIGALLTNGDALLTSADKITQKNPNDPSFPKVGYVAPSLSDGPVGSNPLIGQ